MVDMTDLKSVGLKARVGSTPILGTLTMGYQVQSKIGVITNSKTILVGGR
jgi:hypothetical protein